MAQSESQMEQLSGTSSLRINRPFKADQLLVKLSRNGKEWLSPIGWVSDEKGTLLDCKAEGKTTIVEIPSEFAKVLKTGDMLQLSNPESEFKAEVIWGQSSSKKANGKGLPLAAGALAAGGLSIADTEKRAKEAEKAAADYRAKMEAAAKAREAAQAAALEAARKADEALKAEAARIAEMEQAARAFEEAEKLRLDEQRRLEVERRIEEERRVEEARLAEEARVKAEADRLKKERIETRKFFKSEIEKIKADKIQLKGQLETQQSKASSTSLELAENDKHMNLLTNSLQNSEKSQNEYQTSYRNEQAKLNDIKTRQEKLLADAQEIEKGNEKLFKRLEKADLAYQKAQKEVEAAQARALESLKVLEGVKTESKQAIDRKDEIIAESEILSKKVISQKSAINRAEESLQKSRQLAESERKDLGLSKTQHESLNKALTNTQADISRTQEEIGNIEAKLAEKKAALKKLEELENADDIMRLRKSSSPILSPKKDAKANKLNRPLTKVEKDPKKAVSDHNESGFFSKLFRRNEKAEQKTTVASSPKELKPAGNDVTISKPDLGEIIDRPKAKALKVETTDVKTLPVKKNGAGGVESQGFRLNSWLVLGAAVTGLAVLGTGMALTSNASTTKTTLNKPIPQKPVQLASTSANIDKLSLKPNQPIRETLLPASSDSTSVPENTGISTDIEDKLQTEKVAIADVKETSTGKVSVKLPDQQAKRNKVGTESKTARKTTSPVKPSVAKLRPSTQKKASKPAVDYGKVTREAQEKLVLIGLYRGEINGLQTVETQTAIREFKSIFGLPVNNQLTGKFLNELKKAVEDLTTIQQSTASINPSAGLPLTTSTAPQTTLSEAERVSESLKVAENTGRVEFLDASQDAPVISSTVQSSYVLPDVEAFEAVPASNPYTVTSSPVEKPLDKVSTSEVKPLETASQSQNVQVAELTAMPKSTLPETADRIVPAKVIKAARIEYPSRALRDNKFYNVKVSIIYDVTTDGKVANARVKDIDYTGDEKYRSSFEKAAIKAIERQRFSPKTNNGTPEVVKDRTTRITFRG